MTGALLDVKTIVARAQLGDALDDVDFFWIGRFAAKHGLHAITALLEPGTTETSFYLADTFDAALAPARQAYAAADAAWNVARGRLAAALEPQLGFYPDGDEFIVKRGAITPLPPSVRVVRATPAYLTLAIQADRATIECEDERYRAFGAVRTAETHARRILAEALVRQAGSVRDALVNSERARPLDGEGE
jgi:hypothetical protein